MSRDALVVGISNYKNLPNLGAPAHDAEDIARCLDNFGECRVVRLPEAIQENKPVISQQAGVTTKMLEAALVRLFKPSGKNIPHTAVFYFSGHGLQRNAGIQEGYLATSDTNPDTGNYGLSLYWLRRLLQESPVRQRVVILDCCNSGEFFNILEADPGAKSGTDRLFMAASREYEEAYESLTGSHSVFTQALLSGLNPYKVKGSIVNGHHLIDTVNEQLKGELQQPLFESSGTEIVLTRASGKSCQTKPATVTSLDRLMQLRYKYCPFRGLNPFETLHGDFFFGREALTQSLVQLAQTSRLSLVTGASGIGKTSLLQAGLIHTLCRQNQESQLPQWDIRYVSLGHEPLKQLAEAFVDPKVSGLQRAEQIRTAESFFQNQAQGMTQLVQASLNQQAGSQTDESRILLVIDQFEALFSPAASADDISQRQAIIDCLAAVVDKTHVPIHIVLGMRSQHLQDLESFPELRRLVGHNALVVPAMTYDQLKATIIGPLDKVGLQYDANLIYTLLLDVVGSPGELPLLQLALTTLWQHRDQEASQPVPPRLTLEAYVKLGGLRQMLRHHGTQTFDHLSVVEKPVAQRILLSLGEFGEGSTAARRQVELDELVTPSFSAEQVTATVNKLLAARLVMVHADYELASPADIQAPQSVPAWSMENPVGPQGGALSRLFQQQQQQLTLDSSPTAPYLEISHDSLLRHWPLLEGWLQEHRPMMKLQRSLEAAALEWNQQKRPNHPDYLLGQSRLAEALAFRENQGQCLSTLVHEYLDLCCQYTRTVKRKRNFMRMLIPLSMVMGMLTAYGHSSLTNSGHPHPSPEGTHSAAPAPVPTYQKASPAERPWVQPDQPTDTQTPAVVTPGPSSQNQPSRSGIVPSWSVMVDSLHQQGGQTSRPMGKPLAQSMAHLNQAIKAWEQSFPNRAVASSPMVTPMSNNQQLFPTELNVTLQPVAQWISPEDPQVMIQVWCSRTQANPECFKQPMILNASPELPIIQP